MRGLVASLAVALVAAGTVDAQAAVVDGDEPHPIVDEPALAGSGIAYVPSPGRHRTVLAVRVASGGQERDFARLEAAPAPTDDPHWSRFLSVALDASADALVVRLATLFSHPDGRRSRQALQTSAGRLAGPLEPRSPACETTSLQGFPDLGADGPRVATTGPGCGEASVLDVGTGARRRLPPAARSDIAVAGDLVAWLEPAGADPPPPNTAAAAGIVAVVIDGSGREILRTSAPGAFASLTDLELDRDGRIAVYGRLNENQRLDQIVATASPADPLLRPVPMPPDTASVEGVRLVDGRLAVLRDVEGRNPIVDGEITLMSPQGAGAQTVLRGVDAYDGGFDFDGRQVAAVARDCDRLLLIRHDASDFDARAPVRLTCPLRLAGRPRLSPTGLRIPLSCRGFESSCVPRFAKARLGGPHGRVLGGFRRWVFSNPFTLRLDPATRRFLRSRRRTRIHLSARIADAFNGLRVPVRSVTVTVHGRR